MVDTTDVQTAVDRLAGDLGQSVLIEDERQKPLWWSAQGAVDGTRATTIMQRRVDPLAAAVVKQFRLAHATTPVRTPAIPEADMWARWCMPVRHEDRLLGYLWVLDPDGNVTPADVDRLVECADLAAQAISRTRRTIEDHHHRREELLHRLLLGPDEDAARDLTRLERLPHDARVQIQAPRRAGGWPLAGGMSAHIVGTRPRMATSGTPLPLIDLSEAVRRAMATRRAIAAGAHPDPATWDGLGAWRLVVEAPESLSIADVHPGAEILASQTRTDLTTTARIVLDHGGDVAAAATALHLHRTTVYYRLSRIQKLTGVDLRDAPARIDLQLALWLEAYRRANT
jgi:hypothetical protein